MTQQGVGASQSFYTPDSQHCIDSLHISRCSDSETKIEVFVSTQATRRQLSLPSPLKPRAAMASSAVTIETGLPGSHLWSTTPDIYRSDREENRSGPADQLARVMSPTDHLASSLPQGTSPNDELAVRSNDEYSGRFDVAQVYCQDCNTLVICLYVCTGCGINGHTQCLRLEKFCDYIF